MSQDLESQRGRAKEASGSEMMFLFVWKCTTTNKNDGNDNSSNKNDKYEKD